MSDLYMKHFFPRHFLTCDILQEQNKIRIKCKKIIIKTHLAANCLKRDRHQAIICLLQPSREVSPQKSHQLAFDEQQNKFLEILNVIFTY